MSRGMGMMDRSGVRKHKRMSSPMQRTDLHKPIVSHGRLQVGTR
jgi:hypothetical protein